MVHDDDIGEPVHLDLTENDYPSRGYRSASTPSHEVQELVLRLARDTDWGPHRISKYLNDHHGYDVSIRIIRKIIAGAALDR